MSETRNTTQNNTTQHIIEKGVIYHHASTALCDIRVDPSHLSDHSVEAVDDGALEYVLHVDGELRPFGPHEPQSTEQ
jgi:hypothetical protein